MQSNLPKLSAETAERLLNSSLIAPRSNWSVLKASGPTVREYLQGQITQDINRLTAGQAIHSCILTPQGKAISEFYIIEGNNELFLLTPAEHALATVNRLRQFALGHELRTGIVEAYGICSLQGANATELLERFDLPEPGQGWLASSRNKKRDAVAIVMPETPRGFWVACDKKQIDAACRSSLAVPQEELEAMRILRGLPDFGVEWDAKVLPLNASLIEFDGVSFDKGCYVGQEVVSRMRWRGGIKKRFYRVAIDGRPDSTPCPILTAAAIGTLASAAIDHLGRCFGIAHLPIETADAEPALSLANGAAVKILGPCHA